MKNFNLIHEKINRISQSRGIRKILFVCLGNLCRSPMAEYLLRDKLKRKGETDIEISSGGFLDQKGAHVPEEIYNLMKEVGIDISKHRSSPIDKKRIKESDLIIVMEIRQEDQLVRLCPEEASRIFILSQFDKENPIRRDVADPIGRSSSFYRNCYVDINALVEGLTEHIFKTH